MSQSTLFFQMSLIGITIAIVFDFMRGFRKAFKHKNFFVHVEDTLFWIVTCLGVLYFVLNYADGEIRFFYLLGIFLGALLYFVTVSKFLIKFFVFIFSLIVGFINFLLKVIKIILRPFDMIFRRLLFFANKYITNIVKKTKYQTIKVLDKTKNYGKMKIINYKSKSNEKKKRKQQDLIKKEKEKRLKDLEEKMRKAKDKLGKE